jgi:hypothetical protein
MNLSQLFAVARPALLNVRLVVLNVRPMVLNVRLVVLNVRPMVLNVRLVVLNVRPMVLNVRLYQTVPFIRGDPSDWNKRETWKRQGITTSSRKWSGKCQGIHFGF